MRPHTSESQRRAHIRYRYGIELEDYDRMLELQDHKCFTCGKSAGSTKGTKLYIDHNHDTGEVRKLICSRCNQIAGAIEDERFEAVFMYLEEH